MRAHVKDVWIEIDGKKYYGKDYPKNSPATIVINKNSVKVTFGAIIRCPSPPCPWNKNKARWWIDKVYNGSDNIHYGELWVGTELKEISVRFGSRTLGIGKYRFGATISDPPKYIYFEITRELLKCTDYAFYLNGVRYPVNSRIKARVGDEIRITYRIEFVRDPNPDEIDENGYVHVAVQIWDWKNGEELKWLNYKTQKGLPLEDVVWLTVDKSRNIGIAIYHKNLKTGKWIQDQWIGC